MGGPDDADNAFVSTAIYFRPSTASGFGLSFVMPSKRALLTALNGSTVCYGCSFYVLCASLCVDKCMWMVWEAS